MARGWRCRSRSGSRPGSLAVQRRNKPVSFADYGLHELRLPTLVVEGGTDFADSIVYAAFRVEMNVVTPHPLNDLFPRDQGSPLFCKEDEEFQGLAFEP